ncbi:hypothetical protein [Halomarina rubra]|uniref:Uncharacterized protein n=1 Tax=Halomarina rubra TaxID=2071873 RepID=A0ABD6AW87_9EURY|nr:hypothetical protein [Halomarina rubra]
MIRSEVRELLEEQTGVLLLVAGGLLVPDVAGRTLRRFVDLSVPALLPGWAGAVLSLATVGFALAFVALLGLYYRLADDTPRVAVAGGALMVLTPVLFVSGLLSLQVGPLPDVPNLAFLSLLPYVAGVGLFGLAYLRKPGPVRFTGVPLLVFAGTWALPYADGLTGGVLPTGFPFVELLAASLLAMGYLLATDSTRHEHGVAAGS